MADWLTSSWSHPSSKWRGIELLFAIKLMISSSDLSALAGQYHIPVMGVSCEHSLSLLVCGRLRGAIVPIRVLLSQLLVCFFGMSTKNGTCFVTLGMGGSVQEDGRSEPLKPSTSKTKCAATGRLVPGTEAPSSRLSLADIRDHLSG